MDIDKTTTIITIEMQHNQHNQIKTICDGQLNDEKHNTTIDPTNVKRNPNTMTFLYDWNQKEIHLAICALDIYSITSFSTDEIIDCCDLKEKIIKNKNGGEYNGGDLILLMRALDNYSVVSFSADEIVEIILLKQRLEIF
jgi:hypothetical protein